MLDLNKSTGIAKVEKFEAIQDEQGNWIPVGDAVDGFEKHNGFVFENFHRSVFDNWQEHSVYYYSGYAKSLDQFRQDVNSPHNELFIWISEYSTGHGDFMPGYISTGQTITHVRSHSGTPWVVNGNFIEADYQVLSADEVRLIVKYRFNPQPGHTRNIRSIGFRELTSLPLDQVFTQNDSQILDVTYTINIDTSDVSGLFSVYQKYSRKQTIFPMSNYNQTGHERTYLLPSSLKAGCVSGIYTSASAGSSLFYDVTSSSFDQEDYSWRIAQYSVNNKYYSDVDSNADVGYNVLNYADGVQPQDGANTTKTFEMLVPEDKVGLLIKSVTPAANYSWNYHESESPIAFSQATNMSEYSMFQDVTEVSTVSAVQNVFPRTSASTLPYQDVDALASGVGTISITDEDGWTGSDIGMAEKYRINVTEGGATGTAKYNIWKRSWAGTAGNTAMPRYNPHMYMNMSGNKETGYGLSGKILPFEDGVDRGYHGQSPFTSSSSSSYNDHSRIGGNVGLETPVYNASCSYTDSEFITYDPHGLTIMPLDGPGYNFETNFSDICQVFVTADQDILVADVSTGLWKIERTTGQTEAQSTITRLTVSGAMDDTECRGVQVKVDGTIWAIFADEMCSSADGGSTWTIYNASTATQFKLAGTLDSDNPNANSRYRVGGFQMDRVHADDRFLIPNQRHTDSSGAKWWSRAGSASGTSDESTVSGINGPYNGVNWNMGASQAIYCTLGGVWLVGSSHYGIQTKALNWKNTGGDGYHTLSHNSGTTPNSGMRVHFVRDADGEEWILGQMNIGSVVHSHICGLILVKSSTLTEARNGGGNNAFLVDQLNFKEGIEYVVLTDKTPKAISSNSVSDQWQTALYCLVSPTVLISRRNYSYSVLNLAGFGEDSNHPVLWKKYGWNGSAWQLGNSGTKATHTSSDSILDGLKVSFGGDAAGSFVATEFYDAYVYDGILKDNATTVSFDLMKEWLPKTAVTQFGSGTVPASTTGVVTESVSAGRIGLTGNDSGSKIQRVLCTKSKWEFGSLENGSNVYGQSEQTFEGDFSMSWNFSTITRSGSGTSYYGMFRPMNSSTDVSNWWTSTPSVCFKMYRHGRQGANGAPNQLEIRCTINNSDAQTIQLEDFSESDVFKIDRVGDVITWYRNDVVLHTATNSTIGAAPLKFGVYGDSWYGGNTTLDNCQCTYEKSGSYLPIGNGVDSGAAAADFRKVVQHTAIRDKYNEIFIDGVPATINYGFQIPDAGECTLLAQSGQLVFNPADAGKPVTGKLGYVKKF